MNTGLAYVLKSLMTSDDENKVPDIASIGWLIAGVLALLGIVVFFAVALILSFKEGANSSDWSLLKQFAEGYAIIFAGFGSFMLTCGGALALKTKSGA